MSGKTHHSLVFAVFIGFSLFFSVGTLRSQSSIVDLSAISDTSLQDRNIILKPTIGVGIGSMKFYGDIMDRNYGNPIVGRFGYELNVSNDLNRYFRLKFYVLWGTVSANERYTERNLNFKSKISTGGLMIEYNFGHLLPDIRKVSPFFTCGLESFEFHSKADLYDQYGNQYNYWSDGSIRNLPENHPQAANAVTIQRDYFYETDLREMNYDGYGKYPERSWAVPVGGGIKFHLSKEADFVFSSALHWTFTDLVDNVTRKSGGERMGTLPANKGQDKVLYTAVALHYNFMIRKKAQTPLEEISPSELLALKDGDFDEDGVNDWIDQCHLTPKGVKVDERGCPIDTDKDRIPDYRDEELLTRAGAPVLQNGVEFTDSLRLLDYLAYMDTTGFFGSETIFKKITDDAYKKRKRYQVKIGEFTTELDREFIDRVLSIPDSKIQVFGDTLTVITVGNYQSLPDAVRRKIQLTQEGFPAAEVVVKDEKGTLKTAGDEANNIPVTPVLTETPPRQQPVFRIQVGVYSQKQSGETFKSIGEVMEIKADDKYKYFVGSYTDYNEAKMELDKIKARGFKDAFIVAYKDGNKVTLSSLNIQDDIKKLDTEKKEIEQHTDITYYVQIGIFRFKLPNEVLKQYLELGNVKVIKEGELARYVYGKYSTYREANKARQMLVEKGFIGSFIVAYRKNEMISVREAMEITDK